MSSTKPNTDKDRIEEITGELKSLLKEKNTDFRSILKLSAELSKYDDKHQAFQVDAKTLVHLGRDSIKDHTTALLELVKNSYDADAKNVHVDIYCKKGKDLIRVADNGFGMTKEELINNWLRIGFSGKRKSKMSESGRRKTGEKGIGRISTDRLGACLELISKTKADGIVGLRVNWDDFDVEDKNVFDIDVELIYPDKINIPETGGKESKSGTEIRINKLRQLWSISNIENLYYELSALTPPFNEVKDFEIRLQNDVAPAFAKKVDSNFFKAAEIELQAVYDGKGQEILYTIWDKYTKKEIVETIKWKQLLQLNHDELPKNITDDLRCGPVNIKLLFFLRVGASVEEMNFGLEDLREFLDTNVGVKIYRDHIAVKPYGFPKSQFGYDWLELADRKAQDPAGIGRGAESYSVTPNQLIGAVFISRDKNKKLLDSAAREGLVESEAFYDLRELVLGSIKMLETHRSKIYPLIGKSREKKRTSASKEAETIEVEFNLLKDQLETVKVEIEKKASTSNANLIAKTIESTISKVEGVRSKTQKTFEELLSWYRVLNGLATIGISSAVFGHETESSISHMRTAIKNAKMLIEDGPDEYESALSQLEEALHSSKKVSAWGDFALTRVQREKRSKRNTNIKRTIEGIVKELKPFFEGSSISFSLDLDDIASRTYQMDIESILINLLTNAYTACLQKGGTRKVHISLAREDRKKEKGYYFCVSDTGPGVAKEVLSQIWKTLFSTKAKARSGSKSAGTGLGLTIVQSVITELKGDALVDQDPKLGGARFKIWLPKE